MWLRMSEFIYIYTSPWIFDGPLEFLGNILQTFTNFRFYCLAAIVHSSCSSIGTSRSLIHTSCSLIIAGVANICGFLLLQLESGECNTRRTQITPRATPVTTGDQAEQHIQPIGTNKYKQGEFKTDSDWPESGLIREQTEGIRGQLVPFTSLPFSR